MALMQPTLNRSSDSDKKRCVYWLQRSGVAIRIALLA
jgi:hypothetical protein